MKVIWNVFPISFSFFFTFIDTPTKTTMYEGKAQLRLQHNLFWRKKHNDKHTKHTVVNALLASQSRLYILSLSETVTSESTHHAELHSAKVSTEVGNKN